MVHSSKILQPDDLLLTHCCEWNAQLICDCWYSDNVCRREVLHIDVIYIAKTPIQLLDICCFQLPAAALSRGGPAENLLHKSKIAFHSQLPQHLTGSRRCPMERQCATVMDQPLGSAGRGSCQGWAIHLELRKTDPPVKHLMDVKILKGLRESRFAVWLLTTGCR